MSTEINARFFAKDENGQVIGEAKEATVTYNFGANVEEAISMFGADVVFDIFLAGAKVKAQGVVRNALNAGTDPQEVINNWKPGVVTRVAGNADPVSALQKKLGSLTDEQKKAILAMLG